MFIDPPLQAAPERLGPTSYKHLTPTEWNTRTSLLLVLIALFTLQAAQAQTSSQATGAEPDYLVFQMGADDKDFATVLPELKSEFSAKPAGGTRYVGFG